MEKSCPKLFKNKTLDFTEMKTAFHKHVDFACRQHRRYHAVTSVTKYSLPLSLPLKRFASVALL